MRIIITLFLSFFTLGVNAQYYWFESFEAPTDAYRVRFVIDTVNYHHNIWEIGKPHKTVFDTNSAYSPPNVIVTDTANPYPKSDTSVFIVKHYVVFAPGISLNFMYKLDIDSLAIAKVEISGDNGVNWINPITEDTTYMFYWGYTKPRLDTSSLAWMPFQLNMDMWLNAHPGGTDTFPHYRTSDTMLFRFTFISDTDTVYHDGWMMDNFYVENAIMEGSVNEVLDNGIFAVYPVPSKGNIYYHINEAYSGNNTVSICNMKGEEVYKAQNIASSGFLNLPLPSGNYIVRYSNGKYYSLKRIIIDR